MRVLCALSFLALASMGVSPSFASPQTQNEWVVASPKEKPLYVDLSLASFGQDRVFTLSYTLEETTESIALSPLSAGIFKTDQVLSPMALASSKITFKAEDEAGVEEPFVLTLENHPFAKAQYDYVALSNEKTVLGYGHYGQVKKNPGATYETQRVFLVNENRYFYENDAWGNAAVNAVGYFTEKGEYEVVAMDFVLSSKNNCNYYYADIPYQATSLHFLRLSGTQNHQYLHYLDREILSLSYGVCYYASTNSMEDFLRINLGPVYEADAGMIAAVVESYLTYGKDDSNGATKLTVSNLFETWFANKAASNEDLKNTKILDYTGYSSNGNSYVGLEKTSSFSVNEKWNTMCSQAGIDPKTGKERSGIFGFLDISNPIFIIVVVLGVALLASSARAWYVYKKKKHEED